MGTRLASTDALTQQDWEDMLWEDVQEPDVYTDLMGVASYNDKNQITKVPDGCVMRVNLPAGVTQRTFGLRLDLNGAGVQGAGKRLEGLTEDFKLKYFQTDANDVRHGVNFEKFGLYAHRNKPYKLIEASEEALGKWGKARRGKHFRQANLERYSDNLEEAPSSKTQHWNKNIYVFNTDFSKQPVYDSTLATYTAQIIEALGYAGVATDAVLNSVDKLTDLRYWIASKKIKPMSNGMYLVTVPARQAVYMKKLGGDKTMLAMQKDSFLQDLVRNAWDQVLGKFGDMILVEDQRNAVVKYDNSGATLTSLYRDVGDVDERTAVTNNATTQLYDVFNIHGANALWEAIAMKPRFDSQLEDIGRIEELGMSMTYGVGVCEFDEGTATDTSRRANNSAVALAYAGPMG